MLSRTQQLAFLIFAIVTIAIGMRGFYLVYRRIHAGRHDTDERFDQFSKRLWYALATTLTQSRTFRKRPTISFFHSWIFYGFIFYLLVNLLDAASGFIPLKISSNTFAGGLYNLLADLLSALVLFGVISLVIRRFLLPSHRNFAFNERTMLHKDVRRRYITLDSIVVSIFILFHVGSRAVGAGAKLAIEGPDRLQPFATLLSHAFAPENAEAWRIFGYWGALGSVLLFLMYFPISKHIHIFMAPAKYLVARNTTSGVLPTVDLNLEAEDLKIGANKLEDFVWPRLLDAYACIQCNRCQDVCPATVTGKALSPSALEINKRMELNDLARQRRGFENGTPSPNSLLTFALSPEATWACTTCGACLEACPVQDEPMLDIIDIRRHQIMIKGEFPGKLQTAFRAMERAKNPWGMNNDKRLDWAQGLNIRTTEENPEFDLLFWVGCAASYDPQSQKTARAFVQLLNHAGVNFSVLGKKECCTGDSARRAGNEYLYLQLAEQNISTLKALNPKLIVTTCPHCMNTIGKEYVQIGGNFKVIHHTEYLESLIADGRLTTEITPSTVTYHDPCYLGRHNGIYDAPRNLLNILSNSFVELDRNRENSFCCGAGGAQFWKEEEPGSQRISDNRYNEAKRALEGGEKKVLAVGCPFCKSMLESTPGKGTDSIEIKDVAELLLAGVQKASDVIPSATVMERTDEITSTTSQATTMELVENRGPDPNSVTIDTSPPQIRADSVNSSQSEVQINQASSKRKKWTPKHNPEE
jgi:Fe-S oxidoreductase